MSTRTNWKKVAEGRWEECRILRDAINMRVEERDKALILGEEAAARGKELMQLCESKDAKIRALEDQIAVLNANHASTVAAYKKEIEGWSAIFKTVWDKFVLVQPPRKSPWRHAAAYADMMSDLNSVVQYRTEANSDG